MRTGLLILLCGCDLSPLTSEQVESARAVAEQVEQERLRAHIEALVQVRRSDAAVIPEWDDKPHTHLASARYVINELRGLGFEPVIETTTDAGVDSHTIYVDLPGASDSDEKVLLTAHHDAWYLGADDNATGVAVLLEAARIFSGMTSHATIRLIAFDREEEGLIGARRYVALHEDEPVSVILNMDTIGYYDDAPGSQDLPTGVVGPNTGDFLALLANSPAEERAFQVASLSAQLERSIAVEGLIGPGDAATPGTADLIRSDQAPFWDRGIPGLFFTDTANLRNPHYHTDEDLPETLDYDSLTRAAGLIMGATLAFAEEK